MALSLHDETNKTLVTPFASVYEDPTGELTLSDIRQLDSARFHSIDSKAYNAGFSEEYKKFNRYVSSWRVSSH